MNCSHFLNVNPKQFSFSIYNLQEFILQCNKELLGAPSVNDTEDHTKWYSKLSSPYNIGVLTTQFYQALSL